MRSLQFPYIKFIIVLSLFIFLMLSIITADFFDPTLFHQLYPIGGIKNWFGIIGALFGGTLIELLGPACLLVPWFILKIAYSPKNRFRLFYYAILLITSLSIAYALWSPSSEELFVSNYLLHIGYVGILGSIWLHENFTPLISNVLLSLLLIYCTLKVYKELPIKMIFFGILQSGILLPYHLIQQTWKKTVSYSKKWALSGWSFLQTFNRPVPLSSNQAEEPTIILPEEKAK